MTSQENRRPAKDSVEEYQIQGTAANDEDHPDRDQAARYAAIVIAAALVMTSLVVAANVVVDPRDDFGTEWYTPIAGDKVQSKFHLYQEAGTDFEVLILGTSRVLEITQADLDAVGLGPGYNFGIPLSVPIDHRLVLDRVVADGARPALILQAADAPTAGLDVVGVHSIIPGSIVSHEFTGRGDTAWKTVQPYIQSVTYPYVRDTARSLYFAHIAGYPPVELVFQPDGSARYPSFERAIAQDRFDLEAAVIEHADTRLKNGYQQVESFDPRMIKAWREQVETAAAIEAELVLFMPPIHPLAQERLDETVPGWRDTNAALRSELVAFCGPGVRVFDLTDISTFGGDPEAFRDAVHYYGDNAARIVATLTGPGPDACPTPA